MSALQEFKCPNCQGAISFDSASQKMRCPFCNAEFKASSLQFRLKDDKKKNKDQSWESTGTTWQAEELEGLRGYVCSSCGGEILTDENTVATACPYCDNPVVVKSLVAGELRPDLVIPFKLDKEAAKAALRKHYAGKLLLPPVFKDENHIDEIKGIYVPFWFFDARVHARITYQATREEKWSDPVCDYIKTKHYQVAKAASMVFRKVPVDGSAKLDDRLMESVEPFDMSEAVDFKTAYLAGFLADKYDVDVEECKLRANARIKSSALETLEDKPKGYQTIELEDIDIQLTESKCRYALCPIWLLHTTWRGKRYTFAMNGQTGKLVGDLPPDTGAMIRMFLAVGALVGLLSLALCYLLWYL